MLIAKITESDFFGGEPQYIDDDARYNTRGHDRRRGQHCHDENRRLRILQAARRKYRDNRNSDKAFLREVAEETGYPAELLGYLGWIEEHKFKRKFCMVSHCYVAKKASDKCDTAVLERSQERLGYKIEWMSYDEAVRRLKTLSEQCKEYQMSFVLKGSSLSLKRLRNI